MKSFSEILNQMKPNKKLKGFKMETKHKAVLVNSFGIAIVFLETLHFAGSFNLAVGISLIIIATAIMGTIIAEIREEMKFLKEFAEALKYDDEIKKNNE